ncbi:K+ transport system, NAD-binding component [Halogeometricum borinquense DSM 11551]|uniref:K+ transport system, NAD-binding component n=1 Tax=Halogeometricum borinquense (strain ATCC 700274 / DSM 11551 / JCM 10706 / KCTC 4070 / PR3) TaxID=469382 RepID=E4NVK3_HALBP|nr:TrkA family potassium uptake protein [Halogeometricum borinquense]ADQ68887.1 K+ transport system, NAD-binding component [Halogeometricum borinquense DSM 11551]ELY28984.1 K+ transport system, NAD-binding component [Halogeometricum borinquense DSM 11551]
MYLIVVGAGGIGIPLVDIATRSGHEVVVVETDDEKAEYVAAEYDCLVLNDDATVKETLLEAGARRADAIISTTDEDATNVMVCLLATELAVPSVVSVVHNPHHRPLFERIGANTIENPASLIAEYLYRAVKRPSIVDFMRVGDTAEVFEIRVSESAPIVGMRLDDAAGDGLLPDDVLVVAVERNDESNPITPHGSTAVRSGDLLTVYSAKGATPDVTDVFGHYEDHSTVSSDNSAV